MDDLGLAMIARSKSDANQRKLNIVVVPDKSTSELKFASMISLICHSSIYNFSVQQFIFLFSIII